MPAYMPVTPQSVFTVGDTIETETFDLKKNLNGYTSANVATAVAQFANHLGGTLLVGAEEVNGRIGAIHPMTAAEEAAVRQRISDAVKACCIPQPLFETLAVSIGSDFLVAVNVEASLAGAIAVRVDSDKAKSGYGGASYVFPVRVGIAGDYISPENLHNHMLPELRRLIILLRSMAADAPILIKDRHSANQTGKVRSVVVDEKSNRIILEAADDAGRSLKYIHPLDHIALPWRNQSDTWIVHLKEFR